MIKNKGITQHIFRFPGIRTQIYSLASFCKRLHWAIKDLCLDLTKSTISVSQTLRINQTSNSHQQSHPKTRKLHSSAIYVHRSSRCILCLFRKTEKPLKIHQFAYEARRMGERRKAECTFTLSYWMSSKSKMNANYSHRARASKIQFLRPGFVCYYSRVHSHHKPAKRERER